MVTAAGAEDWQRRAAGGLEEMGCRPGDRVVICLPSSAALLCTVLGALRTGVVPVLLNATLLPHERQALIDDARPQLVITEAAQLEELAAVVPSTSPIPAVAGDALHLGDHGPPERGVGRSVGRDDGGGLVP